MNEKADLIPSQEHYYQNVHLGGLHISGSHSLSSVKHTRHTIDGNCEIAKDKLCVFIKGAQCLFGHLSKDRPSQLQRVNPFFFFFGLHPTILSQVTKISML